MITVSTSGSFDNIERFLKTMKSGDIFKTLDYYGRLGQDALSQATPIDSSLTAESWRYEVVEKSGLYQIIWRNTNVESGIPVAVLIQYGHATRNGGHVEGRDYINPAIQPLFDNMAEIIWERVRRA
jgi:hypothetical protein